MREINLIVTHCSATPVNIDYSVENLMRDHAARKFLPPFGYHYYYTKDGKEHIGRTLDRMGAHSKGFNEKTIGICYEGGLNVMGKPEDTRTPQQKQAIANRIELLRKQFGNIPVVGHRDLSPDVNHDNVISKYEHLKACPCYESIDEHNTVETLKPFLIKHLNS